MLLYVGLSIAVALLLQPALRASDPWRRPRAPRTASIPPGRWDLILDRWYEACGRWLLDGALWKIVVLAAAWVSVFFLPLSDTSVAGVFGLIGGVDLAYCLYNLRRAATTSRHTYRKLIEPGFPAQDRNTFVWTIECPLDQYRHVIHSKQDMVPDMIDFDCMVCGAHIDVSIRAGAAVVRAVGGESPTVRRVV